MKDQFYVPKEPVKVHFLGDRPIFLPRWARNLNIKAASTPCTRHVATGTVRPSCQLCWIAGEAKLNTTAFDRWVDDGGPAYAE